MTKDPRNPRTWSNVQIEQDPEGYVAAQQAYRDDRESSDRQRQEADDERRFTDEYVRNGGRGRDAAAAFRAHRNEQAAQAAAMADAEAEQETRRRARSVL